MVNSLSGHRVPPASVRFYSATKYAVTALLEGWRQEVNFEQNLKLFGPILLSNTSFKIVEMYFPFV